jgi:hypothetical protein
MTELVPPTTAEAAAIEAQIAPETQLVSSIGQSTGSTPPVQTPTTPTPVAPLENPEGVLDNKNSTGRASISPNAAEAIKNMGDPSDTEGANSVVEALRAQAA